MLFHPFFQTGLVMWLRSRRRRTSPAAGERKHNGGDRHTYRCENRCYGDPLLMKECANALSQSCVLVKEPCEWVMDSAYLGPEGCSVQREGFASCLSFKLYVREYTLELSDSVSMAYFSVNFRCSRAVSLSTSVFLS